MKSIGVTFDKINWSALNRVIGIPPGSTINDVFTAEDGENVSADHYEHIGWILLGDREGGKIYGSRERSGSNGLAAYVHRIPQPAPDPMDVRRSEFEQLRSRIDNMIATQNALIERVGVHARSIEELAGRAWETITADREPPMTFYDHAFIHAAINHGDFFKDNVVSQTCIDDAHAAAANLTAARHPVKPA